MGERKKVPKKNISTILVDIKKPDYNYGRVSRFETVNLTHIPQAPKKNVFFKKITAGIIFLVCALIFVWSVALIANMGEIKTAFAYGAGNIIDNFSASANALREFRPYDAIAFLKKNERDIIGLSLILEKSYSDVALKAVGKIVPSLQNATNIITDIQALNTECIKLTEALAEFQSFGIKKFQTDGPGFIRSIKAIRSHIAQISDKMERIRNNFTSIRGISSSIDTYEEKISEAYLTYSKQLHGLDAFLGSLMRLFDSKTDRHIAVLFQNTAEIRPGGGFVGSYADVTIRNGQLQSIDVRDIYDPDGQLDLKVVPPQEINTMTTDWGARDANWFFDFPASARAILYFLEHSKMYSEKGEVFDIVLGININVFESILSVIGPIPLEEYHVVIRQDNFLSEIQREVEAGDDKKAGEPKRILKVLAPIILDRLNSLSEAQSKALIERVIQHISEKDIMVYAKDQNMQDFFSAVAMDGAVYKLPNTFWGSYIAVVNANVAGGKTDVFMKQSIDARIDVDSGGNVFTDIGITRAHTGGQEKDPWWRALNKNFIQLFVSPGSSLVSIKGNDTKNIVSRFDYDAEGYVRYPELDKIEKTKIFLSSYQTWSMEAFGKSVFGTWFNVPAGKEKTLSVQYHTPAKDATVISKGNVFTFVLEKQSGVSTAAHIVISAPLGYIWEESQSPFYTYTSDAIASRTIIQLTLGK